MRFINPSIRRIHPLLALAFMTGAAGGLGLSSLDARAQEIITIESPTFVHSFGGVEFSELLRPDFRRADARILADSLQLEDEQRAIIEVLIEGYREQFDVLAAELKQARLDAGHHDFTHHPHMASMNFGEIDAQVEDALAQVHEELAKHLAEQGENGEVGVDTDIDIRADGENAPVVGVFSTVAISGDGGEMGGEGEHAIAVVDLKGGDDAEGGDHSFTIEPGSGVQVFVVDDGEGGSIEDAIPEEVLADLKARLEERMSKVRDELQKSMEMIKAMEEARADMEKEIPQEALLVELTPEQLKAVAESFLDQKQRLHDQFMEDVALVLNERQAERLPDAQRDHLRLNALPRGDISGESLNVQQVAARFDPKSIDDERLHALLVDWETRVDAALAARNETLCENEIKMIEAVAQQDMDVQKDMMKAAADRRLAVQSANLSAVEAIASEMAEEEAEAFRAEALRAAFPRVYRTSRLERLFEQALAIDDLDPDLEEAIRALQSEYGAERRPMDERLVALTKTHEPYEGMRVLEMVAKMNEEGGFQRPEPGPVQQAHADRFKLDKRYVDRLKALLPDEQYASLPDAKQKEMFFSGPGGGEVQRVRVLRTIDEDD